MFPVDPAGTQDLSHVIGSSGLVAGGSSGQEITLTINNSSLTQALAQVQAQASAAGSSTAAGNPQEITLTISGGDHFTLDIMGTMQSLSYIVYTNCVLASNKISETQLLVSSLWCTPLQVTTPFISLKLLH